MTKKEENNRKKMAIVGMREKKLFVNLLGEY